MRTSEIFDVAVIGAGLAGAFTAFAVAKRGARVVMLEQSPQIASKSSGNLFGLVTPYISTKSSHLESLYSVGYSFTQDILKRYVSCQSVFNSCGALQLPSTPRLRSILESHDNIRGAPRVLRVSAHEASRLAGTEVKVPALHIPDAGFLSPRSLIEAVLEECKASISLQLGISCTSLAPEKRAWTINLNDGRSLQAQKVVICTAYEACSFSQLSWLPLEAIRGQTTCVAANERSASLRCVVSYGGYVAPAVDGHHFVGAHYSHNDSETEPRNSDTEAILARTNIWLPSSKISSVGSNRSRVCFRTSTIDRIPYIGQVPDYDSFRTCVSHYRSGTNLTNKVKAEAIPGLFISVGHGSRGLLSCPLGGEIIARLMTQESLREIEAAATVTDPARVLWRL